MPSIKCKHLNGELYELMQAAHIRDVENGGLAEIGYNEMGDITGYEYHCKDCDKRFKYPSGLDKLPKWLRKIHEQL
jgi:hypothetical protein